MDHVPNLGLFFANLPLLMKIPWKIPGASSSLTSLFEALEAGSMGRMAK